MFHWLTVCTLLIGMICNANLMLIQQVHLYIWPSIYFTMNHWSKPFSLSLSRSLCVCLLSHSRLLFWSSKWEHYNFNTPKQSISAPPTVTMCEWQFDKHSNDSTDIFHFILFYFIQLKESIKTTIFGVHHISIVFEFITYFFS